MSESLLAFADYRRAMEVAPVETRTESPDATAARAAARLGEIVEASTTSFTAQCYVLHEAPAFGSFVRAGDGETDVIAVVAEAWTGSIDPSRRPVARGRDEPTEDDVYRNNPELPEILRTEFTAQVLGYRVRSGEYEQRLPRRPGRLHAFVYAAAEYEVRAFTDRLDFLQALVSAGSKSPADELVAACLREAAAARGGDHAYLVRAGKELAVLLGGDVNRLSAVLKRIRD
jgi:hypothetical protein